MDLKKIVGLIFCTLILGFSFSSCEDDEDDVYGYGPAELSGTWKSSKVEAEVVVTNPDIQDAVINAVKELKSEANDTYIFNLDGTFEYKNSVGNVVKGTFTTAYNLLRLHANDRYQVYPIVSGSFTTTRDVREAVAQKLDINVNQITKANELTTFSKITK